MEPSDEPSFLGANEQIDLARQRRDELVDALDRYWESPDGRRFAAAIVGSGTRIDAAAAGIPASVPALVQETLSHLRSALDELVSQLASLDSGRRVDDAAVPIEASSSDPHAAERDSLMDLHPGHREAVSQVLPSSGAEWTQVLRGLSHPDRHSFFRLVEPRVIVPMGGGAGEVISATANDALKLDRAHRPLMVFDDRGLPVLDTLVALESRVRATLDQFRPCFEGDCQH